MKSIARNSAAVAVALFVSGLLLAETVQVDPAIPTYKRASGISGNLNSIGSDTLNNLMTYWAEGYKKAYPNVNIQIEGKGSSTAPPALIEGTSQLGPMSREMTGAEKDKFEAKYGYKPTQIRVALDGLAVYVNKDNPIEQLTFKQVDGIFSSTRKRGGKDIKTWGDLGLTGEWANKPISSLRPQLGVRHVRLLQGARAREGRLQEQRQGAAGLLVRRPGRCRGQVRDRLLGRRLHDLRGQDRPALRDRRRPVRRRVLRERPRPQVSPRRATSTSTSTAPRTSRSTRCVREFFAFVLSKEGQEIVVKDGFFPLTAAVVAEENAKLK